MLFRFPPNFLSHRFKFRDNLIRFDNSPPPPPPPESIILQIVPKTWFGDKVPYEGSQSYNLRKFGQFSLAQNLYLRGSQIPQILQG